VQPDNAIEPYVPLGRIVALHYCSSLQSSHGGARCVQIATGASPADHPRPGRLERPGCLQRHAPVARPWGWRRVLVTELPDAGVAVAMAVVPEAIAPLAKSVVGRSEAGRSAKATARPEIAVWGRLSALRKHKNAPYKTNTLWKTLRDA
jgi:hypothetical protein